MTIRWKVADTETCGFKGPDATSSGVCEVAWIEIDEQLNELDAKNSLINPGRHIEESASEIHGIFDHDVWCKPTLQDYYLQHWNDKPTVLICHNAQFDRKFLAGVIPFLKGEICTLALARQYLPEAPNHKLATLADYLSLPRGEAHRAGGDVVTTKALLAKLLEVSGRTLPQLLNLAGKPKVLTEMPFGMHKGKRFHDLPSGYLDWILAQGTEMPGDVIISAQMARDMK